MSEDIIITQNRKYCVGIRIRRGQGYYYLDGQEKLVFGIKRFAYNNTYLLRKVLTREDYDAELDAYLLRLSSDETDLETGECFYDVALERRDRGLERIIGCTPMEIRRSVVRSGGVE